MVNYVYNFITNELSMPCGFSKILQEENLFGEEYTNRLISEYKKFLSLKFFVEQTIIPSERVEQVWLLHMSFTKHYSETCTKIFGKYEHYIPYGKSTSQLSSLETMYTFTLDTYESVFNVVAPTDIWSKSYKTESKVEEQKESNKVDFDSGLNKVKEESLKSKYSWVNITRLCEEFAFVPKKVIKVPAKLLKLEENKADTYDYEAECYKYTELWYKVQAIQEKKMSINDENENFLISSRPLTQEDSDTFGSAMNARIVRVLKKSRTIHTDSHRENIFGRCITQIK